MTEEQTQQIGKQPTFSIITVSLNNDDGLRRTHASLKNQTSSDYEWIVVDGGSEDDSVNFLKTTKANWSSEKDEGIFDAMNIGIKRGKGRYALFLNAGDTLAAPKTLEKLAIAIKKQPDFIYGDALETDIPKEGKVPKPFYKAARRYKDLPKGMFTHHQAMVYDLSLIKDIGLRYSLLYEIASDYEFTARYLQRAKRVIYVPIPICVFESGGVSQQKVKTGRREQFIIRENLKMISSVKNVWIYFMQSLAWFIRNAFPKLYKNAKKDNKTPQSEMESKPSQKKASSKPTKTKPDASEKTVESDPKDH